MTLPPVQQQRWLAALLGGVFVLDFLLNAAAGHRQYGLTLFGSAALLGCVYLAMTRPGLAALAGALALFASSFLVVGVPSLWFGIDHVTLSELLAGAALVVLLAWRAQPGTAVVGTSALMLSCLLAIGIRDGSYVHGGFEYVWAEIHLRSLVFGLFLLVTCVAAGLYLRLSGQQRVDSELRTLIRRQWPLAAALTVLVLLDFASASNPARLFVLGGAVVAAVCAFFAPRAPTRAALTGAAAIGVAMAPYAAAALIAISRPDQHFLTSGVSRLLPFSLTQIAASMALIAFAIRYARPQPAAWSTAALVAVNTGTLIDPIGRGVRNDVLLPLFFLLVVSVATGLYFRARDRERNQSVRVAVSGAQNAERLALARELHDVVAHHVTGIVVQAQAARMVAARDPMIAVNALEKIENSGTEALTAMRMLVGSLRGAEPAGGSSAPSQATSDLAADIRALVEQFPGPTVHLELELPDQLPHEMGRSVLRLVQESLTNVSKHAAGATNVHIGVSTGHGDAGEELHVFVRDDGTARRSHPAGGSGGYGLIGMRERVELLGGFFSAGPSSEGGWVVKVALPLRSNN